MTTPVYMLLAFLAAGLAQLTQARDNCYGPIVELKIFAMPSNPQAEVVNYGVLAGVGSNLSQAITGLRLVVAEPLTACGVVAPVAAGSAMLVIRGNCTFTEKARAVQAAGAAAMLLYDNEPGCVTMAFEDTAVTAISPSLAVVSIPQDTGLTLTGMLAEAAGGGGGGGSGGVTLSLRRKDVPLVDGGAALLWLLAVGTVAEGAVWSGLDHLAAGRAVAAAAEQDPLLPAASKSPPGTETSLDLTPRAALWFVVVASAMLLLLYFLLNRVFFFVLLGLFCIASVQAQTVLYSAGLQAGLKLITKSRRGGSTEAMPPLGGGPSPLVTVVALTVAVAVAAVWAVQRNTDWAWVLQDLQGVALMLLVLRSLRVPSIKVAAVLLPACLLYDVFWVFVQPLLFGGGESVMVEVAQGGSSGEFVPMLLRVPHFGFSGLGGYSLLGFGDVILPGMLVAYTRRVDLDLRLSAFSLRGPASYLYRSYFPYTILSYGAGLCLTYAALAYSWFGDQGQPALLYLVPCTLLTVVGLAAARRQLSMLWNGATHGSAFRRVATDHESDPGDAGPPSPPVAVTSAAAAARSGAGAEDGIGDAEAGFGKPGGGWLFNVYLTDIAPGNPLARRVCIATCTTADQHKQLLVPPPPAARLRPASASPSSSAATATATAAATHPSRSNSTAPRPSTASPRPLRLLPSTPLISPAELLPWISRPEQLFGHWLRLEAFAIAPVADKVVDGMIYMGQLDDNNNNNGGGMAQPPQPKISNLHVVEIRPAAAAAAAHAAAAAAGSSTIAFVVHIHIRGGGGDDDDDNVGGGAGTSGVSQSLRAVTPRELASLALQSPALSRNMPCCGSSCDAL
ncbi:hypothetical protein VOLCADRAFT_93422 [Volvox carteri f. nagariensis]|uniref:PA domain-containing protein n=1 Tax=Volvox carteri f. nagariensis TaxID=3068 RepID=D8U231_VOLCA|nr:uncharacterized protein VOLCADRAFT_93422 [Volvox carteri f. nagariensis]EFJ46292.1 hypothetical protein VOLCADRAFT_93422 [Volvox carteri f. nagariensis]|eukprot:XP_002952739.1 hypothetical protein VOLCADRAFT_93422 [Volvox carteri f. nagariensis]